MNINWVGFRNSPKAPAGAIKFRVERAFSSAIPIRELVPLFTTASGLSSWLAVTKSVDARLGGQIVFASSTDQASSTSSGAVTTLNLPKRIGLVTEEFGGIDLRCGREVAGEGRASVPVEISATRYLQPEDEQEWRLLVEQAFDRLVSLAQKETA